MAKTDIATPPQNIDDLRGLIESIEGDLPRRMRDCAAYILSHSDRIAFDTVADTAARANVAPSAMVRFSKTLGLSGFSELQRLFRTEIAPDRPNYQTRLAALREMGDDSPESLLADFSEAASRSIERFTQTADQAGLERAVDLLNGASTIHVIGLRRAFAVASHICYLLRKLDRRAVLHDGVGAFDAESTIDASDVVIAVSFAPYTPATIEFAEAAKTRKARIVGLTDIGLSPLAPLADVLFEIREEEVGGFRSFAATFCLATTLCVAAGAYQEGS